MLKRTIPLIIVFATALVLIVAFFIPRRPFGDLEARMLNWYAIIAGFTFLLGLDSLARHHIIKITRRAPGWFYSAALLLGLFLTLGLGMYSWFRFQSPFALQSPFMWLYTYMIIPLQSTIFGTLAFFIVSAAYRAFRIRNFAATLLLFAAGLVMLGNTPLGGVLWRGFAEFVSLIIPAVDAHALGNAELPAVVKDWLMSVPQAAASRGIGIGLALGGMAMSLRIILGIERTYLS